MRHRVPKPALTWENVVALHDQAARFYKAGWIAAGYQHKLIASTQCPRIQVVSQISTATSAAGRETINVIKRTLVPEWALHVAASRAATLTERRFWLDELPWQRGLPEVVETVARLSSDADYRKGNQAIVEILRDKLPAPVEKIDAELRRKRKKL